MLPRLLLVRNWLHALRRVDVGAPESLLANGQARPKPFGIIHRNTTAGLRYSFPSTTAPFLSHMKYAYFGTCPTCADAGGPRLCLT